jgi:putative aminopeptidase FrvX
MDKERLLEIAAEILRQPTAPFHEGQVRTAILGLLQRCGRVAVRQDDFGNVIAHYRGTPPKGPEAAGLPATRWAFGAHMDHPAWVTPPGGGERRFLGGVPPEYLEANRMRVREFDGFAMWDLPAFELREERIYARACDDLIGCAAIVGMLVELAETNAPGECYGLFTRAEEVGFAGAMKLAQGEWLAGAGLTVISLETSSELPPAKMGAGPIVRVGDRTSVFDPAVTAELLAAAERAGITVQRCLMSGGTCEATAFQLYGVRAGALCVALGNYHNRGPDLRIEQEFVSVADFVGLTALCVALARGSVTEGNAISRLRERLERNLHHYAAW